MYHSISTHHKIYPWVSNMSNSISLIVIVWIKREMENQWISPSYLNLIILHRNTLLLRIHQIFV